MDNKEYKVPHPSYTTIQREDQTRLDVHAEMLDKINNLVGRHTWGINGQAGQIKELQNHIQALESFLNILMGKMDMLVTLLKKEIH